MQYAIFCDFFLWLQVSGVFQSQDSGTELALNPTTTSDMEKSPNKTAEARL